MGHAVLVSDIARLVGVQRTVQKNGNVKSEPKYLIGEESPTHVLSTFELFLVLPSLYWLLNRADFFAFIASELPAVGCIQHLFMHLAPQICMSRRASHAALPVLCSQ